MAAAITSLIAAPLVAATGGSGSKGMKPGSGSQAAQVQTPEDAPRVGSAILFPRSNYVWPFASGPIYGQVEPLKVSSAGVLHTRVGSFDLTRGMPNLPSELRKPNMLATLGSQYFLLQVNPEAFRDGSFDDLKGIVTAQGGAIVAEMPVGGFIVRMTQGAHGAIKGLPSVIALEPYHPAFKISPEIGRIPLPDPIRAVSDVYSLELQLFPGEDASSVAKSLADLGVQVLRTYPDTVYVNADRSKLAAIAGLEPVVAINENLPIFPHSEETTSTVQTGRWNTGATPYNDQGIDGRCGNLACTSPQVMMLVDTGIQLDAGELSDTRTTVGTVGLTHRKVLFYGSTVPFGGTGDLLGCDAGPQGGFTHGHTVAAVALGNATKVPAGYGTGFQAPDINDNPWDLDGLAPRAKLVAYDAGLTPLTGACDDPHNPAATTGIFPGDLYSAPSGGSLGVSYTTHGARIVNFSWGTESNTYSANSQDIDQFILDKGDAMVFISAGNSGADTGIDGIGEPRTVGTPATAKNATIIGASNNANDQFNATFPESRPNFSSLGPAGSVAKFRTVPTLMAPGTDVGAMGLDSEFNCRSLDNDQNLPVECDIVQNLSGTSFASPAAAGAGLLVRDYFAQGFYPDGTAGNTGNTADKVGNVSGMLTKAVLIASADYMDDLAGQEGKGGNLDFPFRFSNEQGYGRIQLTNALPLQTYPQAVTGLIVADGGIAGGVNSTTLNTTLAAGGSTSTAINVCDTSQPISIGLAWADQIGNDLVRDLDLELLSPAGRKYIGNFYTDNENANNGASPIDEDTTDAGEGCEFAGQPWPLDTVTPNTPDNSAWSLPVQSCPNATADSSNPTEGIHLSPDPRRNGIVNDPDTVVNEAADNQIESGIWTLTVKAAAGNSGTQNYALAVSGGVCLGSSVRIQRVVAGNQLAGGTFVCNDSAVVTVNEVATGGDPIGGLTAGEISSRTTVQVVDAGPDLAFNTTDDVAVDTESGLTFTDLDGGAAGLRFDSAKILLTDGTGADPGNGVLDVRSGQQVRVIYQDENPSGTADPNARRVNVGTVDCRTTIAAGGVVFGQFGKDAFTLVSGGCEKDPRGYFTFGFPDRYMDKDELVCYLVAFPSSETGVELQDVTVSLRAVATDADSPVDCKPGAVTCADPNRANNPPSPHLTILDSPKVIGSLPAGATATPSFTIQVSTSVSGVQQADMVLGVAAKTAGKGVESFAVQRETLNVDPVSFFYSTDFPTGGIDPVGGRDFNNNEVLEAVTNDPASFVGDFNFETRSYSDATVGGFNTTAALRSPWNFDTNDGGFTSGIQNGSRPAVSPAIAEWGEDKNFNGRLDGFCSGAPTNPCTQGLPTETCDRCSNDPTLPCTGPADCGGNACNDLGSCTYSLDEDRDIANNGQLDRNWGTRGGCGWQTRGAIATGGIWHTGRVDVTTLGTCLASGTTSARCQFYERHPTGDAAGDIYWWEMLLTPVVNKVNQCPVINGTNCPRADVTGDPVYQVAITDWAWNMEIDLADNNSAILTEFDTDIDKLEGADFYNDFQLTNIALFGVQGALAGGNAPIMNGFNLFAPVSKCVDTNDDGNVDHCTRANGVACTADTVCTGNDINGIVGGSRNGDNNCAFEGKTAGVVKAKEPWGIATPKDDDVANGFCLRSDALNNFDKSVACVNNNACTLAGAPYTTCSLPNAVADEFVQTNGPGRNYGMQVPNGPDMRFSTLEDFYGDTGKRFQAAVGFYNREPVTSTVTPNVNGYGLGLDDMFISWKESRLDEDTTLCAGSGECADIEIQSTLDYDASSIVTITVTDKTPYDAVNNKNDCNGNGSFGDVGDDQDCNNNSVLDVTVKLISINEPAGEIAVLDQVGRCSNNGSLTCTAATEDAICGIGPTCNPTPEYKGNFPYSSTYNSPGTLYVQVNGTANPVVTALYDDRNDGTGSRCKNALEIEQQGSLRANCTIILTGGRINFKGYNVILAAGSPGDNDSFADPGETIDFTVTLINKSGVDIDDIVATLATNDTDKIECISKPIVLAGSALNNAVFTTPPFRFKVKDTVSRTDINDLVQATFNLALRSNKFDAITRSISVSIDLDLNASGGGSNSPFIEDFEGAGLGQFTLMSLDANKTSLALSDGWRCQYNDPFGPNSNSTGDIDCFLGFPGDPAAGVNDWHIQASNAANCNSGRAFTGVQSLRWGTCPASVTTPVRDTTRFKQVDAVKTVNPIFLPLASGAPELTWKHQASLVDNRNIANINAGEATDRGVVQIQLADNAGNPVGDWVNLEAYENAYDQQGTDDFTNCTFDPIDDGNDEDDYFDPTDPLRRLGPSSTCFPEFTYARSGHTDWRLDFNIANIGLAGDGPGLQGNPAAGFRNPGTWVSPKVNLLGFAGRAVRIRFLATSIELGTSQLWDELFAVDNVVGDDGWFVDDVRVDAALSSPLTISVDPATLVGQLSCGVCTTVTPVLTATPAGTIGDPLDGPGQIVTLDATDSTIDVCNNGIPQYQFWIDTNENGIVGDSAVPADTLQRDWTDNPVFIDAPLVTTTYGVVVRCSTAPACDNGPGQDNPQNAIHKQVHVACPNNGNAKFAFPQTIRVDKAGLLGAEPDNAVTVSWPNPAGHDIVRGSLNAVRTAAGNFTGTDACQVNNGAGNAAADGTAPAAGTVLYYLVRAIPPAAVQHCNQTHGYTTNNVREYKDLVGPPPPPPAVGRDPGLVSCAP